jgi:hypothetical protein
VQRALGEVDRVPCRDNQKLRGIAGGFRFLTGIGFSHVKRAKPFDARPTIATPFLDSGAFLGAPTLSIATDPIGIRICIHTWGCGLPSSADRGESDGINRFVRREKSNPEPVGSRL